VTDLIASLSQKITERWLTAIILPGLLYTTIVSWALLAGHRHALDLPWFTHQLNDLWQHRQSGPATLAVAIAAGLAAASLAGVAATMLAEDVVHRIWVIRASPRRRDRLATRAQSRWNERDNQPPQRYLPQRATVIGEHFRLIGERVHAQYGLSVTAAWPRVWVLTTADTRILISAAHRRYHADATTAAWALLYLPWTLLWWPAALIAAITFTIAHRRARTSSAALATLIEATIDTHAHALARAIGVDLPEGRLTPDEGNKINDILLKRA